jgi:hypothetical protein
MALRAMSEYSARFIASSNLTHNAMIERVKWKTCGWVLAVNPQKRVERLERRLEPVERPPVQLRAERGDLLREVAGRPVVVESCPP